MDRVSITLDLRNTVTIAFIIGVLYFGTGFVVSLIRPAVNVAPATETAA